MEMLSRNSFFLGYFCSYNPVSEQCFQKHGALGGEERGYNRGSPWAGLWVCHGTASAGSHPLLEVRRLSRRTAGCLQAGRPCGCRWALLPSELCLADEVSSD